MSLSRAFQLVVRAGLAEERGRRVWLDEAAPSRRDALRLRLNPFDDTGMEIQLRSGYETRVTGLGDTVLSVMRRSDPITHVTMRDPDLAGDPDPWRRVAADMLGSLGDDASRADLRHAHVAGVALADRVAACGIIDPKDMADLLLHLTGCWWSVMIPSHCSPGHLIERDPSDWSPVRDHPLPAVLSARLHPGIEYDEARGSASRRIVVPEEMSAMRTMRLLSTLDPDVMALAEELRR